MSDIINPLSSESYTNKDFQTIYVELLEAAKTLAKNWDPTISNESDPGVVLLKLNAIIADKNNYNIDKNVLENYPETYTQEISARSQYKQLGYKMPWYRAATTKIGFKWVGDKFNEGDKLTIPKHTMIMDAQGNYVYTILRNAELGNIQKRASNTCEVEAIQGIIHTLKLSGSTRITLANLDSKNRLYINDHNIAQNGIYISFADNPSDDTLWKQVDNVELMPYGTLCYEFDIDAKRNIPYLQFPEDIRNLIKSGITVKYIVTSGYDGNVAAKTIDTFYDQGTVNLERANGDTEAIPLTAENFLLYNLEGTINGQDPETIESAAKSFRKQVCTFDTLITLRDYFNAIYSFGKEYNSLSNVMVTDRTTDIQSSYRIIDKDDGLLGYIDHMSYTPVTKLIDVNVADDVAYTSSQERIYKFDPDTNSYTLNPDIQEPEQNAFVERTENVYDMNAFDLKFYILKTGGLLNTLDAYANTFSIDNSEETKLAVNQHLSQLKSVQHDTVDIKKYTPFMLQNVYPIKLKLVPTFKLNEVAKSEVIANIRTTLIKLLNSRECEFGKEPSYDIIYNAISTCDERIKVVILDDFKYTTFALYLGYSDNDTSGEPEFKYIPISDYSTCSRLIVKDGTSCTCDLGTTNNTEEAIRNALQNSAYKVLSANGDKKPNPTEQQIESYRFIDSVNGIMYKWPKKINAKQREQTTDPTQVEVYSRRLLDIRKEVIARNVLAGVTPLFDVPTSTFGTTIDMNQVDGLTASVSNIATELEIAPFGFGSNYSDNEIRTASYKLRANESLRFLAPSFISDRTYANYVKYELVLKNPVTSASEYVWADPEKEQELFDAYGTSHFYVQTGDNVYSPLFGSSYEPLKDIPTFKLNYYHGVQRGYATAVKEIITNSNHFDIASGTLRALLQKVKTYEPEYESYMYYKLGTTPGQEDVNNKSFNVISRYYPEFNGDLQSATSKLYRLKHYYYGTAAVQPDAPFISGRYFIYKSGERKMLSTLYPNYEEFAYDAIINHSAYMLYKYDGDELRALREDEYVTNMSGDHYIYVPKSSTAYLKNYLETLRGKGSDRVLEKENAVYIKLENDELKVIEFVYPESIAYGLIVYEFNNIVDSFNCDQYDSFNDGTNLNPRFEKVKRYSSNLYLKVERDGKLVGYKVIESDNESNFFTESALKGLIEDARQQVYNDTHNEVYNENTVEKLVSKGYIVIAKEPVTWKSKYNTNSVYTLKYQDSNSLTVQYARPSAPPDYMIKTCLEKKSNAQGDEIVYEQVTQDSTLADTWDTSYSQAFYQASYSGLHTSSPEYLKWKNGTLALYIKKGSYKINANTEYQLRDGDYIVFFWRATDEDDADYIYRKYTHIYDENTKQKTIIKPSFPLKASTYGNRLFNHDNLQPSGTIRYSTDNKSPFQIIFQKMYDEYDLSGSRQIEIRKMNSVKLDPKDNKYYYFICPETEHEAGTEDEPGRDVFSMKFDYSLGSQEDKQYRYQHILQPDEYFIYMNSDQTLYEVLGEGTLIEYITSNSTDPIPGEGAVKEFRVTAINSNDILYQGIDAFREYCKTVEKEEIFNLIEQQIYSFVKDDVVQITLKDHIGFSFDNSTEESATHYLDFSFQVVSTRLNNDVEEIEQFVDGEYYTLPNGADKDKFESYKAVEQKPLGWDDLNNWTASGKYHDKYYRLLYANYIRITKETTTFDKANFTEKPFIPGSLLMNVSGGTWKAIFFKDDKWVDGAGKTITPTSQSIKYISYDPSQNVRSTDYNKQALYVRIDPAYPIFTTNKPKLVKDFNVSYSAVTNNNNPENTNQLDLTYSSLPSIDVEDEAYGWRVTAHLNVMCDNEKAQKIEVESPNDQVKQKITILGNSFPDKFFDELTEAEKEDVLKRFEGLVFDNSRALIKDEGIYKPAPEVYILSSIPLDKVGSAHVDVSYVDLLGERQDTKIFTYNLNSACVNADLGWQVADAGLTLRVPADSEIERDIEDITLDSNYKYILPISILNDKVEFSLSSQGNPVKCLCCDSEVFGGEQHCGKHFIEILPNNSALNIKARNSDKTNDIHILFETLFKYKYRDIYGGDVIGETNSGQQILETTPKYQVSTKDILDKIREIDVPGKFKYTHVPSIDVEIKDPLDPISMFNENHVYHKFTIARAELDKSEPYDASYDVVNNK